MLIVTLGAADDDVEVRDDQLTTITEAQLEMLGMSRDTLTLVFKDAAELMKDVKPGERGAAGCQGIAGRYLESVFIRHRLTRPYIGHDAISGQLGWTIGSSLQID